jgi:hypothetical protein
MSLFGQNFQVLSLNFFNVGIYYSEHIMAPLFKNSTDKIPSMFQRTLAITLPAKVCTLNLLSIILPTISVQHPSTSIFGTLKIHSKDTIFVGNNELKHRMCE